MFEIHWINLAIFGALFVPFVVVAFLKLRSDRKIRGELASMRCESNDSILKEEDGRFD